MSLFGHLFPELRGTELILKDVIYTLFKEKNIHCDCKLNALAGSEKDTTTQQQQQQQQSLRGLWKGVGNKYFAFIDHFSSTGWI